MIPIAGVLAATAAWLTTPSAKVNQLIPEGIREGSLSVLVSVATKRYVLLAVLIALSIFGSDKQFSESALRTYVTDELGISQAGVLSDRLEGTNRQNHGKH